ncbi:MAG: nucleotidyltransferase family protein [Porticoccaceae bacterium]
MKAMILAAGFGKRLRPLTDTLPKPMVPVNGKPLIQYHVERLAEAGIRELVINTAWLGEQIEQHLGDGSEFGVSIHWSRELQPLETGGGIYKALPLLGEEPFVLVNGDIWSDYPFTQLSDFVLGAERDVHLVLVLNPEHHPAGDYCLDGNAKHGEKGVSLRGDRGDSFTFSGISVINPALIADFVQSQVQSQVHTQERDKGQPVFPLRDALQLAIDRDRVTGEVFDGYWCDVGTPQRLAGLEQRFK